MMKENCSLFFQFIFTLLYLEKKNRKVSNAAFLLFAQGVGNLGK